MKCIYLGAVSHFTLLRHFGALVQRHQSIQLITNAFSMLEYNTTGVQTPSTDNLNTSYLVEFPISPSAICVILNDLSRRGSVIKPPLHTRTGQPGVGINKDAEQ